jgi:hypothetical protein
LLLLALSSADAAAQTLDTLGNRPTALAAFVAVADDAAAVAWNPAGLVHGPFFNVLLDLGRSQSQTADRPQPDARAGRLGSTLVAIGLPPLGLSYYRLRATTVTASPAVVGTGNRQEGQLGLRSVVTTNLGATVLQSLGEYLTVGATVRLVRGHVGTDVGTADSWDAAFERDEELERRGSTRGDVDAGLMFAVSRFRAGLVVRNVTTPTFADAAGEEVTLDRHARVGVAWGSRWPGTSPTIVALDADVTRVLHPTGPRRDVAVGVERWLRQGQLGLRGGVRASTLGAARTVVSGGVSYALRSGTFVDGYVARGQDDAQAWGISARFTY